MDNNLKKCTKCNLFKTKDNFSKHKFTKDKMQCHCRECISLRSKQLNEENPNYSKEHYRNNIEHYKEKANNYYLLNKEDVKKKGKIYRSDPGVREEIAKYHKNWVINNREKQNKKSKERKKNNPLLKLQNNIYSAVNRGVKKFSNNKGRSTLDILGVAHWEEFKLHIENQWEEKMNWGNWGIGKNNSTWHIDHKIPLSSANNIEELIKLNHHSNMRPMWGSDNIRKKNNII